MYTILSDCHLHNWSSFSATDESGINTRLNIILQEMGRAVAESHKRGIKNIYIAGDLFHVRGKITPSVLNPVMEEFECFIKQYGVEFRIIPGNHDLESKNTAKVTNAVQALESLGCVICNKVTRFEDDNVIMVPWYDKLDDLREVMKQHQLRGDNDLIIHAPLNGVLKGIPDNGLSADELMKLTYKRTFVGHYHNHRSFDDRVFSIGATTHQNFSDIDTKAGFLIVSDDKVEHIESAAPKFVEFPFGTDEENKAVAEGNYVRLRLGSASEKEVKEYRAYIEDELGAAGCIVIAQPKVESAERKTNVSTGASLNASIESWIEEHVRDDFDRKAVYAGCQEVLDGIEEVS